jgi:UDP-N-acetylmuramate dehydrogenase
VSLPVDVESTSFGDHTTMRIGGTVDRWIVARTEEACIEAIVECDDIGASVLVVGGGSNIVCNDGHFAGTVVQVACTGIKLEERDGLVHAVVAAGEDWDAFVQRTLQFGSGCLAPLSGIPGLVGATPIQNVGAYGTEISQVIDSVRVWDRRDRSVRDIPGEDCGFGYRSSAFKSELDRYLVLEVTFVLPYTGEVVVGYQQLADALGVNVGDAAEGIDVRHAVLELRRAKGMVLDEADHDTWSVGSFFVNPIIDVDQAAALPAQCPSYPSADGTKVSSAWLIESCAIDRGFQLPGSSVRVSTKHTLAICNTGAATSTQVVELAREIRDRVLDRYGIELTPEPRLVGLEL